jgi:hypothetical protein
MRQLFCKLTAGGLLLALFCTPLQAQDLPPDQLTEPLPSELATFVEAGMRAFAVTKADLNGDGKEDALLVLEKLKANPSDDDVTEAQRPLLLLIRQPDGTLKLAKRNDRIIRCSTCGGVIGDPFQPIDASWRTFTVSAFGGSSWRWTLEYKFSYSRKDDTWQLVHVSESNFHSAEPHKAETKEFSPPKDFGKIDIADFDPENWKGKGAK